MGKTRESIQHLEQAVQVSDQDVKDVNVGVYTDLVRFQAEKEDDLKRYMVFRPLSFPLIYRLTKPARVRKSPSGMGEEEPRNVDRG